MKDAAKERTGPTLQNLFFCTVIFFVFIAIAFIANDYNQSFKKAKDSGVKSSSISALQVQSTFEQVRNILILISSELEVQKLDSSKEEVVSKYLFSRNMLISDVDYLILADEHGNIKASSNEKTKGKSLNNASYFKDYQLNSDQLIQPIQRKSLASGELVIPFIHRVHDGKNKFAGIVEAGVPLSFWFQYFRKQMLFPNDEISIVDLKTCSVLGTSAEIKNGEFRSKYIQKDFCQRNFQNISDKEKSYVEDKTNNVISYSILPEFKVAVVSVSIPADFLTHFYRKISGILLISLIIFFWFWRLVKFQTITEEKLRLERIQNINSSKMASLGEMAGGIAHEINSPLAAIVLNMELLIDMVEEDNYTKEELVDISLSIKSTADRIGKIVNGLRFFARDGSALPMMKVEFDSIIEDTLSFCSERMRAHNITLTVEKNYTEGMVINCRDVEISQVLLNLLNNASDAVSGVDEKWIKLIVNEKENEVEINIVDSGVGIPKHLHSKIMEPFFTTKDVGKGTGIGLSISKGIINSHHGKLYVDQTSTNTKFTILLPKNSEG